MNSYILRFVLAVFCMTTTAGAAQVAFEDLEFESKTSGNVYKPRSKNHAFIRSKRGTSGVNRNEKADSITSLTILEIVLVYTEMDAAAKAEREEANRERWENLIRTYPEYFDYNPYVTNHCQCNPAGDSAGFKKMQGFYIYFEGDEPMEETEVEEKSVVKTEPDKKPEPDPESKKETAKEERSEKQQIEEKQSKKDVARKDEKPARSNEKISKKAEPEITEEDESEAVKETPARKRVTYTKPRRAKDPKACRPPFYENGDEDLNAFFRENITLSKKQKKKGKTLISSVRIQLNLDGTIKKAMVTGANAELNKQVQEALAKMNQWNPAVKNGVTIRSDVRMNLKYDKDTKSMKPSEIMINPRPAPKCKYVSDAELFGSN